MLDSCSLPHITKNTWFSLLECAFFLWFTGKPSIFRAQSKLIQQCSGYLSSLLLNEPSMEQLGSAYRLLIVAAGAPRVDIFSVRVRICGARVGILGIVLRELKGQLISSPFMISRAVHLPMDEFYHSFLPPAFLCFLCLSSAVFMFGICPSGPRDRLTWPPAQRRMVRVLAESLSYILITALWFFFHCSRAHRSRNVAPLPFTSAVVVLISLHHLEFYFSWITLHKKIPPGYQVPPPLPTSCLCGLSAKVIAYLCSSPLGGI